MAFNGASMSVFADISVSLDGFVAGPNDGPENGLGEGGERLHEWLYDLEGWRSPHGLEGGQAGRESELLREAVDRTGAAVMGRRMFDIAEPHWGDEPPFHGPVFVLTHRPRDPIAKRGGTTFTFVTEGVERAVELAKESAAGKDVSVSGGAATIQEVIRAGLLDEIQIHVVPLLLGGGRRLFEGLEPMQLERTRLVEGPAVTHLRLRLPR